MLGIGERNGITPLGGFVARMLVADRDYVRAKYDLTKLKSIEDLVANAVEVSLFQKKYLHQDTRFRGMSDVTFRFSSRIGHTKKIDIQMGGLAFT